MIVAFSVWNGRISPVFDVSQRLVVLDIDDGQIVSRLDEQDLIEDPLLKVARLKQINVGILVCGAVSRHLSDMLESSGIRIIPFIAGDAEDVIQAFMTDALSNPALAMPGCCGRQGRGHNCGWRSDGIINQQQAQASGKEKAMPLGDGTGPRGQGPGTGQGKGRCRTGANSGSKPGQGRGVGGGGGAGSGQGRGQGRGFGQGKNNK